MSLTPVDLVSAHPWQRVAFTTYALSLSFFEAIILDALVRGGGRSQALILSDVQGVRASLSEQGAHRVGKDYEVEPVAVSNGIFHPKMSILSSPDECHVLVGSGNLTFGGWGGNCEILEHLHPAFAADAIADAAEFFELMPAHDRIRQGAAEHCAAIAAALRRSIQGRPSNGGIRLFHNLDASITEQVAQIVTDLGGAVRLVAAAPIWDGGAAVDRLCQAIGLPELFVHAHAHGCIEGIAGANWPRSARTPVRAVRVAVMDTAEEGSRRLHAKAFEILCKRGRVLVSGSANGTAAALGPNRNIEACVVRIQRERSVGWTFVDAEPPEPQEEPEDTTDSEEASSGVLRATLEGDEVTGQVLTPRMSGPVSVYHLGTMGPELLADTTLGPDAAFRVLAPDLEKWSWRGGRLVIRVRHASGQQAEGFVSVASFADITRRAGLLGRRLLALLAGNETPADVAAILSWFHEDPQRLAATDPNAVRGGSVDSRRDDSEQLISVATLSGQYAEAFTASTVPDATSHRNWSRFTDQILLAFRDPRGPFGRTGTGRAGEDEEDDTRDDPAEPQTEDPAVAKSLSFFARLFELLTKDGGPARHALIAFDLTQYVCDRLRPDAAQARGWLDRLIKVLLNAGVPPERRDDFAAAVLTALGISPQPAGYRWARGCMLRLGVDLAGEPPSADGVRGFQALLLPQATFSELWMRLRELLTYPEQVRAYLQALKDGKPSSGYPDLPGDAPEEWPVLEDALISPQSRGKLILANRFLEACPRCHLKLPSVEISKLRSKGIATTHCCRKIVIWQGA